MCNVLGHLPDIVFQPPQVNCEVCQAALVVSKVKTRNIYTVAYGAVSIRERIKKCPVCGRKYRSERLRQMVKPSCNYAYDVLVEVGRLRYMQKRQILEIQDILAYQYRLEVSPTQIRRLSYQFLYYLGRFHYHWAGQITKAMAQQGGYILYIDSTCEGKGVHLFTCLDGQSGYVLYSKKIKSENSEDIEQALGFVKDTFGTPLCCVHDMGVGINSALDIVFEGIMRIICHFHLLRDIGKDLLAEDYQNLQKSLSKHNIYAAIRYQANYLEKIAGNRTKAEELFFSAQNGKSLNSKDLLIGLLYGLLQGLKAHQNCGNGYGFPFDRAKLDYYRQLQYTQKQLHKIDQTNCFDANVKKESRFYKVKEVIDTVLNNRALLSYVKELEQRIIRFDKFRIILRIAQHNQNNGLKDQGKITTASQLAEAENSLKKYINTLKTKAVDDKKLTGVINQIEKYWDKIFAHPIKININGKEKEIIPQRTNNTSEQFYRKIKHLLRRLHGKPTVSKDIDYLPEEIALIENLNNQNYVEKIMGGLENMAIRFAQLDIQNIELEFPSNELQVKVPQKIIRLLKKKQPIEVIADFEKRLCSNN